MSMISAPTLDAAPLQTPSRVLLRTDEVGPYLATARQFLRSSTPEAVLSVTPFLKREYDQLTYNGLAYNVMGDRMRELQVFQQCANLPDLDPAPQTQAIANFADTVMLLGRPEVAVDLIRRATTTVYPWLPSAWLTLFQAIQQRGERMARIELKTELARVKLVWPGWFDHPQMRDDIMNHADHELLRNLLTEGV